MGIILDSSVFISAERKGLGPESIRSSLRGFLGAGVLQLSVITLGELAFGLARAESASGRAKRRQFLEDVRNSFALVPVSAEIAFRAGLLRAALQRQGLSPDFSDQLLAATALELDYGVATSNLRHFERVPGLRVVGV